MDHEKTSTADYKIFSDGSNIDGRVGTAAILYKKGEKTPKRVLKAYLGEEQKYTSYDAEMAGNVLSAWMSLQIPERATIDFFCDSQAAVQSLSKKKNKSGQ